MKKLARQLIDKFSKTKLWKWFVLDFMRITSINHFFVRHSGKEFYHAYNLLRPGDIILTSDSLSLSSFAIPGEWSHAGICVGKGMEWEISEMLTTGYAKSHFYDIFTRAEKIKIIRCFGWSSDYVRKVINNVKSYSAAEYDYTFGINNNKDVAGTDIPFLYCSEMIWEADVARLLNVNLEDVAGLGRPYLSPDGLANSKNVITVWEKVK